MVADALRVLRPAAVSGIDYRVEAGPGGDVIAYWNPAAGTQPTPAELAAVTAQQIADLAEQGKRAVIGMVYPVRLGANQPTSSTTLSDVPGLAFHLKPNAHYSFSFYGAYTTAAAGTGIGLAIDGPASPSVVGLLGQVHEAPTTIRGGASASYNVPLNGQGSAGATPLPFEIRGNISTTVGGKLALRFRSTVGGSAVTIRAGSWGELKPVE